MEKETKRFKSSMFNEYLGCLDGQWVIYNNLSSAMIEVPENIFTALANNQIAPLSHQSINTLSKARFVVEKEKDEITELRNKKEEIQETNAVIGLQILPTLACNFRCDYCYEKPVGNVKRMPRAIMDKIVSWVVDNMRPTTKVLNVMWFGGEPLLAVDQIKYLSRAFLEITKDKNISYYSNIITNGYLLTEEIVNMLLENRVKSCMVTIDGPEGVHDRRRMLKNGGKTWRIIINNVKLAIKKGMAVTIRVNVDKANIDCVDRLLDDLEEHNILHEVGYFFGVVTKFGHACSSIDDRLLSMDETDKILKQKKITDIIGRANNFKYRHPADLVGCVASARNSYVVDPDGELYKCSKIIGDPAESCGNIANPDPTHPNFVKWLDIDNFYVESCSTCSMIPVCRGKVCAFDILNNSGKYEHCNREKDHPEYLKSLIKIYRNKKSGHRVQNRRI
jgi:uncharacterized protein